MSATALKNAMPDVIYLSAPSPVHMADEWFKIASLEHFWIKRRFDVLRKVAKNIDFSGKKIGEVGCGCGLLQKQFEQCYGVAVDGFDLNAEALRESIVKNQPRFCYNIFERNPQLAGHYDFFILFDVIEHIEEEKPFLEAALFHLKPGGCLLINVPGLMAFYSAFDKAVGHQRRYTLQSMHSLCAGVGLKKVTGTYWGLPLLPILFLRNMRVSRQMDTQTIIRNGYKPPGRLANQFLGFISALEYVPQQWLGTSLMVVYRKEAGL
jgi:SAM-dependent methyltransferase